VPRQATKAPQSLSALNVSRTLPPNRNNRAPDILRKPSLYVIPAWPSSGINPPGLTQMANTNAHNGPSVLRGFQNAHNGQKINSGVSIRTPKRPHTTMKPETVGTQRHTTSGSVISTVSAAHNQVQSEISNEDESSPQERGSGIGMLKICR
jgi:hypothetical protein